MSNGLVSGLSQGLVSGLASGLMMGLLPITPVSSSGQVIDIDVSGVPSAEAVGRVTIDQPVVINLASVPSAETIGAPTLTAAVPVSLTSVPTGEAVGASTLTATVPVSLTSVPSEEKVGNASLAITSLDIQLASVPSAEAVGAITIQTGTVVNVDLAGTPSSEAIGAPTLGVTAAVSLASVPSGEAVGKSTIAATLGISLASVSSAEAVGATTIAATSALTFTVSQSSNNPSGSQSALTDNTSTTGGGTNSNTPAYIQLDLGANYTISKLVIGAGSIATFGSTATTLNASSIKYSTDNSSFSTAASITGMSDTLTSTALYQSFTGGNNSARYWRIERSTGVLGASEFQPVGTQSFSYPQTFTYSSGGDTNGVLYYLGYSTFGSSYYSWSNPAVIGNITVTPSASLASSTNIYALSDRNNSTNCSTSSSANQTITIDFGSGRSFRCDSYTLRSSSNGNQYPRNWKIRGSNDNSSYTDIDVRSSNTTILASTTWYQFTCNQSNTNSYRYIQFQITGTNSGGFNTIDLSEWDFYGVLS